MEGGIVFIDKEAGMTSRKVDNLLGRLFNTRKVGHLGTLDPFATGLLICGVNAGNKALRFARDEEKEYEATLKLGVATSTGDYTGEEMERASIPSLTKEEVEKAVSELTKEKSQIPPMTSAIKVDGVALYKLAHKGEEISREPRPIEVYQSTLISFAGDLIVFRVKVSKGTYIRTLGETLANHLGTVGHLTALRRLSIGPFSVEKAKKLEEVTLNDLVNPLEVLGHMPIYLLTDNEISKVRNGVRLKIAKSEPEVLLVYEGKAIAIYEKEGENLYRSLRGLE